MPDGPRSNDPAELPEIITSRLVAHQAGDPGAAVRGYLPDATVTDEGGDLPRRLHESRR